ncbi:hypothetical protein NX059_003662 [Plenodomus lindquistii]|nr:hypothetical protein NX059_003662 [Plenodomus lindquistii]
MQALEKKLETTMRDVAVMNPPVEEPQPQDAMQPPFPRHGNPVTPPDDALFGVYQDFTTGAPYAPSMYPLSSGSACNTSDVSSFITRDQPMDVALLPYYNTPQGATPPSHSQLSEELQDLHTSQFTFPSEHAIEMPTLKTMEVSLRIAQMLGLTDAFLDLTLRQVIDISKFPVPLTDMPENLRPTELQLSVPHYPVIDVIPWPTVRNRLINLFHQPEQLRPRIARGPMAIMQLMHDLDDETEGLRVVIDTNGNGYDSKAWEVGQTVFKDWWWTLDSEIISNSNRLRRRRGVPDLQI